ncbi:MAG: bifunctional demethylmenaquinone methyltransferase/2-methoxy-6-polyprenyl-1,4-benzoquinol methylase UbiE [bacterium]
MTEPVRDTLISARDNCRMFDQIAPRYDLINSVMSLGLHRFWRRRAVHHLLSRTGHIFLDVGCGTGEISLAVARHAPNAQVTAIDPSREMLHIAESKTIKAGLDGRIAYQTGDATALPFSHATFDGIVCAFCLRNITNRATALREMRRVLRPGGTLAILELTAPLHPFPKAVHRLHTRRIIPLIGRLLSQGSAYHYLADSIDHFPPAAEIVNELVTAGFPDACQESLTGGFVTLFTEASFGSPNFQKE